MGFKESVRHALANYSSFKGRARRSEYIYFTLFVSALVFIITMFGYYSASDTAAVLTLLLVLATVIPSLAVSVRRLHDVNKPGAFLLMAFLPLVRIYLLYLLLIKDGDVGDNSFGPDPKADEHGVSPEADEKPDFAQGTQYSRPAPDCGNARRHCTHCGAELEEGDNFCKWCGTRV